MATEVLEMEARLKNYISGEVNTIKSDIQGLESQSKSSMGNVGKHADAASQYMNNFEHGARRALMALIGFQAAHKGLEFIWKGIEGAGLDTENWHNQLSSLQNTIGKELLPDVQTLVGTLQSPDGLKGAIVILRSIVAAFKEVDVGVLMATGSIEKSMGFITGLPEPVKRAAEAILPTFGPAGTLAAGFLRMADVGGKSMTALGNATIEEAKAMQKEIAKAMDFSTIKMAPPTVDKEKVKKAAKEMFPEGFMAANGPFPTTDFAAQLKSPEIEIEKEQQDTRKRNWDEYFKYVLNSRMQELEASSSEEAKAAQEEIVRMKHIKEMQANAYMSMKDSAFSSINSIMQAEKASGNAKKAVAMIEAAINTALAISQANASAPYPYNIPMIIAAGATGVAQEVAIASQNFAMGGIVGGNSYSGDRVRINANSGEMVLNSAQQANLFRMANNSTTNNNNNNQQVHINLYGISGGSDIETLADNLGKALVLAKSRGKLRDYEYMR